MQRLATIVGGVLTILLTAYLLDTGWSELFDLADPLRLGIVAGGFVAAMFVGELGRLVRLPRIVGYLLVGFIIGPFAAYQSSHSPLELPRIAELFSDFDPVFTGALALTGLAVGLRFRALEAFSDARRVLGTALGIGVLAFGALSTVIWFLEPETNISLLDGWQGDTWVLVVLAGLLVSTSGVSAIWGTNAELKADSSFTETQLQIAVVKDSAIAAVILMIIAARLFDVGDASAYSEWFARVGIELAVALGAGLGSGLILLATLKWMSRQIVPMSLILAVLAGLIAASFPGIAFVGGVAAGIVVASGTQFSQVITESLDRGSPVILSIVFLHLGLLLELPMDRTTWIAAGVIVVARLVVIAIGAAVMQKIVGPTDGGVKHDGRAMVAQGMGTLLLALYVVEQLPDANGLLFLVTPVILVDALLGPIIQRSNLVRLGVERPPRLDVPAPRKRRGRVPNSVLENPRTGGLDVDESLLPPADFQIPELDSNALTQLAERVRTRLHRTMDRVAAGFFEPARRDTDDLLDLIRRTMKQHVRDTVEALRHQPEPDRRIDLLRARRNELDQTFLELFKNYGHHSDHEGLATSLDTVYRDLQRISDLPATVHAPELPELWKTDPEDSRWIAARKAAHRFSNRFGPPPMRSVPVRAISNEILVNGIVARLEPASNMVGQNRLYLWHRIEIAWSEIDEMYARSLDRTDLEAGRTAPGEPEDNEEAELIEFDRRLAEGDEARPQVDRASSDDTSSTLLTASEDAAPEDAVAAYWQDKLEALPVEHEQLTEDVWTFERDTRRRTALAFSTSFNDFIWALQRAGTFLLPTRALQPRGIDYHADSEVRAQRAARHWRALVSSHLDRRAMRLQLRILQSELHPLIEDAVDSISRELASRLTYYPAETSERCREVVSVLGDSIEADASVADLLDAVVQLRASLADFLQDDALHSLQELRQTHRFAELISEFVDDIEALVARQPEVFSLPSHDLLKIPETESAAHVEHVTIPFRQILERSFVSGVSASFKELDLEVRATIDRVTSGLGEINRVVSFNLDAAASELRAANADDDEVVDLVSELAVGGLRRAGQAASELLTSVEAKISQIERSLVELSVSHLKEARQALLDDDVTTLAARAQQSTASPIPRRGKRALTKAAALARKTIEAAYEPVSRLVETAEERLSFDEGDFDELRAIASSASFDDERFESIPNTYRRLFAPVAVEIPEIFVARPGPAAQMESAVSRWRAGHRTSIVVTGHRGHGRTSFIHRVLAEQLSDLHVVRWNLRERLVDEGDFATQLASLFGIRRVFDTERMFNALKEVSEPRLVLIDGLEKLYLRDLDGAGAIRALTDLISRAPDNILWLATCNSSLYTHLVTRLGSEDFFTDRIDVPRLDRDQLEEMIMRRHRVSGYQLFFLDHHEEPTEGELDDKAQAKLQRRYFDRLYDVTSGHPLVALFHWLTSVEPTDKDDTLVVRDVRAMRTGHLRHLGVERQIALGQIALHGELDESEFATVMRLPLDEARRRIASLESIGVVERAAGRRELVALNEVLHHEILRAIEERNLI